MNSIAREPTVLRPNTRLQLTAFGVRDRGFFEVVVCSAPRRQRTRQALGGSYVQQNGFKEKHADLDIRRRTIRVSNPLLPSSRTNIIQPR